MRAIRALMRCSMSEGAACSVMDASTRTLGITLKTGPLQAMLHFLTLHKRVPNQCRAEIFRHQHGHARVDSDHVRVIPVFQGVEGVDEPVAAPGTRRVTLPDVFENAEGGFGPERERTAGGAGNHGSIDGPHLRRAAPDHVASLRVRCRDAPEIVAVVRESGT